MLALRAETALPVRAPVTPDLSETETAMLNHLRLTGLRCRAKRKADLFHACAMLSGDRTTARTAHAEVLMRCLGQALGRQPVFHAPGEAEVSFDEAWVIRLSRAIEDDDIDSATFLLKSRVVPHARRNLAFLIRTVRETYATF